MTTTPGVAVLFARADSHYKALPGCDVWDEGRDARNWQGGTQLVLHTRPAVYGQSCGSLQRRLILLQSDNLLSMLCAMFSGSAECLSTQPKAPCLRTWAFQLLAGRRISTAGGQQRFGNAIGATRPKS